MADIVIIGAILAVRNNTIGTWVIFIHSKSKFAFRTNKHSNRTVFTIGVIAFQAFICLICISFNDSRRTWRANWWFITLKTISNRTALTIIIICKVLSHGTRRTLAQIIEFTSLAFCICALNTIVVSWSPSINAFRTQWIIPVSESALCALTDYPLSRDSFLRNVISFLRDLTMSSIFAPQTVRWVAQFKSHFQ